MGDCCGLGYSLDFDGLVERLGFDERAWEGSSRARGDMGDDDDLKTHNGQTANQMVWIALE